MEDGQICSNGAAGFGDTLVPTRLIMAYARVNLVNALKSNKSDCKVGMWNGELFKFNDGDIVEFPAVEERSYTAVPYKASAVLNAVLKVNGVETEVPIAALRRRPVKPVNPAEWELLKKKNPMLAQAVQAPLGHLEWFSNVPAGTYKIQQHTLQDQAVDKDGTVRLYDRTINILTSVKGENTRKGSRK